MEDYESDDVLAELARLCDELGLDHMDSEAMACETHIFVDANGNPHECWEAGPGHINVTVAMTPEQAVRITDVMAENAKLREVCRRYMRRIVPKLCEQNAELHRENAKLRTQLADVTESMGRVEKRCARLRELCKRFSDYVSHDRCEGCVYKSRCNDGLIDECWQLTEIRKLASELGVVVDC